MSSLSLRSGMLVGLGNALIDITAEVDENFLAEWNIRKDEAVRGDSSHDKLLHELQARYQTQRMPGGSGFNVLRTAQWMLRRPNVCTFMGCVGDDDAGKLLQNSAKSDGIFVQCQVATQTETSYCAILVTGDKRSMCSFQKASGKFSYEQYMQPESQRCLENASFFYLSGYFLNVSLKTAEHLANYAHVHRKPLIMDLGAPRVVTAQAEMFKTLIPLADVVFGNNEEMTTLCTVLGIQSVDMRESCVLLAHWGRTSNCLSPKLVVMTSGKYPVVLASSDSDHYREFPCPFVDSGEIVDVNGAGDAFLGGFLASYIQSHTVEDCTASGLYAANVIVRQRGCSFPDVRPPLPATIGSRHDPEKSA